MGSHLVIQVHLHDRFHGMAFGAPEWPPSPARLFQALLAGVARGKEVPADVATALRWLERLPAPRIGVPPSRLGASLTFFVPNNDLDAKGGDPANLASIRTSKRVQPRLIEGAAPLVYCWQFESGREYAEEIVRGAEQLYQLGRGVDLAWARAEILDDESLDAMLASYPGIVHQPGPSQLKGAKLLCPVPGSLDSLLVRFNAVRLEATRSGKKRMLYFQNPPKPHFRTVTYGRHRALKVYRFQLAEDEAKSAPQPLHKIGPLVERIRDRAASRLREALEDLEEEVERVLVGRKRNGKDGGPIEDRVRIIPLPSIGHWHADHAIRRIAVEIPGGSRLAREDIEWAFNDLTVPVGSGSSAHFVLAPEPDAPMLDHYVKPASRFRSVTPLALPEFAGRRRIEPSRMREKVKGAEERLEEETRARKAVLQSLRHAGVFAEVRTVHVQREPYDRHGERAERFAEGTRFSKHRLWHVQIEFGRRIEGPLVLGDGRFLGLGIMRPVASPAIERGVWAFSLVGEGEAGDPVALVRAFRRAVMARVAEGRSLRQPLEPFFSGHSRDGQPLRTENSAHLSFQWDSRFRRLLVIAPHRLDRRKWMGKEEAYLEELDRALLDFSDLRAGREGRFGLKAVSDDELDFYEQFSSRFVSVNRYSVTRHARNKEAYEILAEDIERECKRRGLPIPKVTVLEARGVSRQGLQGRARLEFGIPVRGPIALGRNRFLGGGLFLPE